MLGSHGPNLPRILEGPGHIQGPGAWTSSAPGVCVGILARWGRVGTVGCEAQDLSFKLHWSLSCEHCNFWSCGVFPLTQPSKHRSPCINPLGGGGEGRVRIQQAEVGACGRKAATVDRQPLKCL